MANHIDCSTTTTSAFTSSQLCEACSVICFNDKELLAGYAKQADDGSTYLDVPRQQSSESVPRSAAAESELWLKYKAHDTLPDLPHLRNNADSGCQFCRMMREQIIRANFQRRGPIEISLFYSWGFARFGGLGLTALVARLDWPDMIWEDIQQSSIVFTVETDCEAVRSWLKTPFARQPQVLSDANVHFIKNVLQSCEAECHHLKFTDHTPTRLLDLQASLDDPAAICLVDQADLPSRPGDDKVPCYVALSYCWGSPEDAANQLRTTTATLASRKTGIPETLMTQSVRDAVRVCRSLSIRYLWIDALCIIQDDAADWQRESASMAFIYNNAYCTIVAASTSSCHQSFLERRFDMITVPFVSRINPESAGHYGLYASGYGAGGAFAWPTLDFDKNCNWLHRGWTYQERKMSRRSIFFGRNMIHFECSSMAVAENQEPDSRRALSRPSALGELIKHQDPNSVYKQWDRIITSLNLKEFTFVHDKLPSVSGIAKLFAGLAGGDRYVAGLWQQDLPFGLLWFSRCAVIPRFNISLRQLTNRLRHPTPYIVPSWSPAYISDTQISRSLLGHRIERQEFRPRCSVIEAQVTVNGENAYGQVQDGVLKVRGRFGRIPSDFFLLSCAHSMVEVRYLVDSGRLVAYCSPDCWSEEEVWPRDEVALLVLGSSDALGSFLATSHSRRDNESWGRWHCNAATYGWYGYKTIVSSPTRDATRPVQEHGVREETDAKAAGAALSNEMEVPNEDDKGKSTWGSSGESDTKEMKSDTQPPPTLEFSKLDMVSNGSDDTTRAEADNGVTSDGKDAENATTEQKIDQDLEEEVIFTNSDSEKPSKHEFSSTVTTESYCPTFNYFDRIGNGWYEDNEDAWGLLLAPAAQEGKWIRVGAWWSVVGDGGGTRYFDKFDVQEVDII